MEPITSIMLANLVKGVGDSIFRTRSQERLAIENRQHTEQMEKLRQDFQNEQSEKNYAQMERIQKQMAAIKHENALQLVRENYKSHIEEFQDTQFLNNCWPLVTPPKFYLTTLMNMSRVGRMPIQIVVPDSLPGEFSGIVAQLTKIFNCPEFANDVYFYNNGWKESLKNKGGTAQIQPLKEVLGGFPTLVIFPSIDSKQRFSLSVSYWGVGDAASAVTQSEICSIDLKKVINDYACQWIDVFVKENGRACPALQSLIDLRTSMLKEYDEYKAEGKDTEVINRLMIANYGNYPFASKYGKHSPLLQFVNNKIESHLYAILAVVGAAMTDLHRLMAYHEHPVAPKLLFNDVSTESLLSFLSKLYNKVLESVPSDNIERPLYYALVASSFNEIPEGKEYAISFAEEGWQLLDELYASEETPLNIDAPIHVDAFKRLSLVKKSSMKLAITTSPELCEQAKREFSVPRHSSVSVMEREHIKRF